MSSRFPSRLRESFQSLVADLGAADRSSFAFAGILDLIEALDRDSFDEVLAEPPRRELDAYWANYLAATIEQAAGAKAIVPPDWVASVPRLRDPVFGSKLASLRLHLLLESPPSFCARNIFIDAAVGDRV